MLYNDKLNSIIYTIFSASENEKSSVSMLAPVLGFSLLFNVIVIISLILAFTGSQRQDNDNTVRRKVGLWWIMVLTNMHVGNQCDLIHIYDILQEKPEQKTNYYDYDVPASSYDINTDFASYPAAVQDAIAALKAQYELEDGELEAVVRNLWADDPSLGYPFPEKEATSTRYSPDINENLLSPEEAYITLPRYDNSDFFT